MDDRLRSKECAPRLKALADPKRLKLVLCLRTGAKNISELAALLGVDPANASHHARILRDAGLVTCDKRGTSVVYSLSAAYSRPQEPNKETVKFDLGCCRVEVIG